MKFNLILLKELAIELINGLNVNQLNVNNWYETMNISVNSLKANVIGSWINWMEVNLIWSSWN